MNLRATTRSAPPDSSGDDRDWLPGLDPDTGGSWALGSRTAGRSVAHLVLLDGRLVDVWDEPVEGTRWEHLARETVRPVVQLPHDENQDLLDWLTTLCGSRAALDALTDEPLHVAGGEAPGRTVVGAPPRDELDDLLVRLGDRCFDDETVLAMRRAATMLASPRGPRPPDLTVQQRASGIAWAVGRANGLVGPGLVSTGAIQHTVGLTTATTAPGRAVGRALAGPLLLPARRPHRAPDLLAVGRTDLLLGATRRALVDWRDQALAAQAGVAARHLCTTCASG